MRSAAKLVVLVGILGGLHGCREEAAPVADNSEAPARLVLSMEVHPVTRDGALFTGVVAARTESELGFRVAGEVIERRVDPGDRVKRGDVLLVLDVDDFELALWIRNAFDEAYIPVAFQASPFDPTVFVGETGAPQTFGATLRVSF